MSASLESLHSVRQKLKDILEIQNNNHIGGEIGYINPQTNNSNIHKKVVLDFYIDQIKKSIEEVSYKIEEIHETISQANETPNGFNNIYNDLVKEAEVDRVFIDTFGPYMIMLQTYLDIL
jgi:hypothetical protein